MSQPAAKTHDTIQPMFTQSLVEADPAIEAVIKAELHRQREQIELIASENIVSRAVLEAAGSVLTNKYAEGYPGRRYYGGCEEVDKAEQLAIERACKLFDCSFANVQPHSGAQANQAVFMALLKPGDTFLGMALDQGGHLTHGSPANQSGKWFKVLSYGVKPDSHLVDYEQMEEIARREKPKLIIAGASAYSRQIDWARFRKVADEIGAFFMVDMAHYAGLVAGGVYPNPLPYAHVVTTTTHKTLRGPRGGLILSTDAEIGKKINSAVFPGLQGGPLMHIIAAKAVALGEALKPDFKVYAQRTIDNARALASALTERGLKIVSGGTDSHVMLVDLRPKKATGVAAEKVLDRAGITVNKNSIPGDPEKYTITSGVRLGSPAGTTRGFGVAEFSQIGHLIADVLDGIARNGPEGDAQVEAQVRGKVRDLCSRFPIYRD
jgi:glycine hydroxymethyltransferase